MGDSRLTLKWNLQAWLGELLPDYLRCYRLANDCWAKTPVCKSL
jgi:hypothetical protein